MSGASARVRWALFAGIVLAAALRIPTLGVQGFWLDEVLQTDQCHDGVLEAWRRTPYERSPLDYALNSIAISLFPFNEAVGRAHACVLSLLTVGFLGVAARRAFGARAVLPTVLIAATAPVWVRFGQEASHYAAQGASEAAFFAALLGFVRRGGSHRWRAVPLFLSMWWCAWAGHLTAIAAFGTAGLAFVLWGAFARKVRTLRRFEPIAAGSYLLACIAAFVGYIPLLLVMLNSRIPAFAAYDGMSLGRIVLYLDIFALGVDWYHTPAHVAWWLLLPTAMGVIAGSWRSAFARTLLAIAVPAFFFGTFAIMKVTDHWVEMRYCLIAWPPLVLLAGAGYASVAGVLARFTPRRARPAAAASLAGLLVLPYAISGVREYATFGRQEWRPALVYAAAHARPGDRIAAIDILDVHPVRHYLERTGFALKEVPFDEEQLADRSSALWVLSRENAIAPPLLAMLARMDTIHRTHQVTIRVVLPHDRLDLLGAFSVEPTEPDGWTLIPFASTDAVRFTRGFDALERWDPDMVATLPPSGGELRLDLPASSGAGVRASVCGFRPDLDPPLALEAFIDDVSLGSRVAETPWNWWHWDIPPELTGRRVALRFVPSRSLRPVDVEPDSDDDRSISFRIKSVEVTAPH